METRQHPPTRVADHLDDSDTESNRQGPKKRKNKKLARPPKATPIIFEEENFEYPPPGDLAKPVFFSRSHLQILQFFSTHASNFVDFWIQNQKILFLDETFFYRMPILSLFLDAINQICPNLPPILIITTIPERWIVYLHEYSNLTYVATHTSAVEKRHLRELGLYYSSQKFTVFVAHRDTYLRDPHIFTGVKWGVVIYDDYVPTAHSQKVSTYFPIVVQTVHQSEVVTNILAPSSAPIQAPFSHTTVSLSLSTIIHLTLPTIQSPDIYSFTIADATAAQLYFETVVKCPMTQHQVRSYSHICSTFQRRAKDIGQLGFDLLITSSHSTQTPEEIFQPSGKLLIMAKILARTRSEDRKVAIICHTDSMLAVHLYLTDLGLVHLAIESGARVKGIQKVAEQFNMQDAILIIPSDCAPSALRLIFADTIITFDLSWVPTQSPTEVIMWQAQVRIAPAEIIRLVTADSFESLLFEYFWHNREIAPIDFFEPVHPELVNIIQTAVNHCADRRDGVRGSNWTQAYLRTAFLAFYFDSDAVPQPALEEAGNELTQDDTQTRIVLTLPIAYWNPERLNEVVRLLMDFGWGRWDSFTELNRPVDEVIAVAGAIIKAESPKSEYPKCAAAVAELTKPDVRRFMRTLAPNVDELQLNRAQFLVTIELLFYLDDAIDIFPETAEDDNPIINAIATSGLSAIPPEQLDRVHELLQAAKAKRDEEEKPVLITIRTFKKFTLSEHERIVRTLMNYGYPDNESISRFTGVELSRVQNYVPAIIRYCSASSEERKGLIVLLAEKIPKYNAHKIVSRLRLFETLRAAHISQYPAENLELIWATARHGMIETRHSPIILCACSGNVTDTRLFTKLKIAVNEQSQPNTQLIDTTMPLRINEMLMITNLGVVDPRPEFSNNRTVYPIGYRVSVVFDGAWLDCAIDEKEGLPWFTIRNRQEPEPAILAEGDTPDVFKQLAGDSDGEELFGLTSAVFHRAISQQENIDSVIKYQKRWFRAPPKSVHQWPVIGQFEKETERPDIRLKLKQKKQKQKQIAEKTTGDKNLGLALHLGSLIEDLRNRGDEYTITYDIPRVDTFLSHYVRIFDCQQEIH